MHKSNNIYKYQEFKICIVVLLSLHYYSLCIVNKTNERKTNSIPQIQVRGSIVSYQFSLWTSPKRKEQANKSL